MSRYITCIISDNNKNVKVYSEDSEWMVLKKVNDEYRAREYRVKYIRNLDGERLERRKPIILY